MAESFGGAAGHYLNCDLGVEHVEFHTPQAPPGPLTVGIYLISDALTGSRRLAVASGASLLRTEAGHRIVMPSNLHYSDGYAAGTPDIRRSALSQLAHTRSIDVFLSGWGGKAAIDVLRAPGTDLTTLARKHQPWFGFSDACVLLNAITFKEGLVTFYGPNVLGKITESEHGLLVLNDYRAGWPVFGLNSRTTWRTILPGKASGILIGGNLSTFATAYCAGAFAESIHTLDKVFFFECADEDPRVQRQLLTALDIAGFFETVVGVVIGHVGGHEMASTYTYRATYEVCAGRRIPMYSCPTFGHARLENPPIPIGMRVMVGPLPPTAPVDLISHPIE